MIPGVKQVNLTSVVQSVRENEPVKQAAGQNKTQSSANLQRSVQSAKALGNRNVGGVVLCSALAPGQRLFPLFYMGQSVGHLSGPGVFVRAAARRFAGFVRVLLPGRMFDAVYTGRERGAVPEHLSLSEKAENPFSK